MHRPADEEVQFAVELAALCKTLRQLPRPGGILDQDSYHIHVMKYALAAFVERENKEANDLQARSKMRPKRSRR